MATLAGSITNTALPSMARELGASASDSIWIVTAYQLAMLAAMLPLAALGDIAGHRRVLLVGLSLFALASLACGIATSLSALIGARLLQGLGAAAMLSTNTALVRAIYPPARLGHGLGLNALVSALGLASGPTVASAILTFTTWHWIFLFNLPLCALSWALVRWKIEESPRSRHRFDAVGALLCALMFGGFIHGLSQLTQRGGAAQMAVEWLLAAACGAGLLRWQAGRPAPMLPLDLLRRPTFALSTLTIVLGFLAQGLALVALPFLFQRHLGRSLVETGLLMTPWPVVGALMAPLAGRLSDRMSATWLGATGLIGLALGLAKLALLEPTAAHYAPVPWMMLCGFGIGLFFAPIQRAIMGSAPSARSGAASGVLGTGRLLGQTLGAALVMLGFAVWPADHGSQVLWFGVAFASAGALTGALASASINTPANPPAR